MGDKKEYTWNEILSELEKISNLKILQILQKIGLPKTEKERTELLIRLNHFCEGDYPITYEGVCMFSNEFHDAYPKSHVISLIQHVITGAKPYPMEINHSNLSEEEKALLFFVLPMSKNLEK